MIFLKIKWHDLIKAWQKKAARHKTAQWKGKPIEYLSRKVSVWLFKIFEIQKRGGRVRLHPRTDLVLDLLNVIVIEDHLVDRLKQRIV